MAVRKDPRVAQSRGTKLKPSKVQVQILPRGPAFALSSFGSAGHFWNANRTSEPGLGANECVPSGKWRKPTAFRHFLRA